MDTWFFYENGRVTAVEEDTNKDGLPDLWEQYDEAEALVKRERDLDFDGTPDVVDFLADSRDSVSNTSADENAGKENTIGGM